MRFGLALHGGLFLGYAGCWDLVWLCRLCEGLVWLCDAGQMQEFGFWLYKLQEFGLALLARKFGLVVQAARFG
jgi:hypothetical protein